MKVAGGWPLARPWRGTFTIAGRPGARTARLARAGTVRGQACGGAWPRRSDGDAPAEQSAGEYHDLQCRLPWSVCRVLLRRWSTPVSASTHGWWLACRPERRARGSASTHRSPDGRRCGRWARDRTRAAEGPRGTAATRVGLAHPVSTRATARDSPDTARNYQLLSTWRGASAAMLASRGVWGLPSPLTCVDARSARHACSCRWWSCPWSGSLARTRTPGITPTTARPLTPSSRGATQCCTRAGPERPCWPWPGSAVGSHWVACVTRTSW